MGVIAQVLVPRLKGGRTIATELLINTSAVKNLIREGKNEQIDNILQTGRAQGMHTLKHSLNELVAKGEIDQSILMTLQ